MHNNGVKHLTVLELKTGIHPANKAKGFELEQQLSWVNTLNGKKQAWTYRTRVLSVNSNYMDRGLKENKTEEISCWNQGQQWTKMLARFSGELWRQCRAESVRLFPVPLQQCIPLQSTPNPVENSPIHRIDTGAPVSALSGVYVFCE